MIKIVLSFILVICIINVKGQNTDEKEKVIQSIQDLPAWTSAISAYKDGLSDVAPTRPVFAMVRAAQASPDHGFCGVRARAGDPSCLELR